MPRRIPANRTANSIVFGCLIAYQPPACALVRRSREALQIVERMYTYTCGMTLLIRVASVHRLPRLPRSH